MPGFGSVSGATGKKEGPAQPLRVFISYSRRNAAMADEVLTRLKDSGFEVTVDRRDLEFGEAWQAQIAELIRRSDTVVWLVSEESIGSKWVNWELDEVARRHKRLVPVMVGAADRASLPRQLGEIQILPTDGLFVPDRDLPTLVRVLQADRVWLKEASRLSDRAHEWIAKERPSSLLLRGTGLRAAEQWKMRRPEKAPVPAQETLDLILSSRQAATSQMVFWVIASLLIATGGVLLALFARNQQLQAEQRERESRSARLGASSSLLQQRSGPFVSASGLLALESMRLGQTLEADQALRQALNLLVKPVARIDVGTAVYRVVFDATSRRLAVAADASTTVVSADSWKPLLTLPHPLSETRFVAGLAMAAGVLVLAEGDGAQIQGRLAAWDVNSGTRLFDLTLQHTRPSTVALSPDASSFAVGADDGMLRIVRLPEKTVVEMPLAGKPLVLHYATADALYAGLAT